MKTRKEKTLKKMLCVLLAAGLIFAGGIPAGASDVYADEAETTYMTGDLVQWGSYPQSLVTDEALIAELDALEGVNKSLKWTDGSSDIVYAADHPDTMTAKNAWRQLVSGVSQEAGYTLSEDVSLNGETYRRIVFTAYRTPDVRVSAPLAQSIRETPDSYKGTYPYGIGIDFFNVPQEQSGYLINTEYYFKYEPITWRVLDPANGYLMSEQVLDVQPFNNVVSYGFTELSNGSVLYRLWTDSAQTSPATDYAASSVREWLYTDFYQPAFTFYEKDSILPDQYSYMLFEDSDSAATELYEAPPTYYSAEDYVTLPSYDTLTNTAYGFDYTERSSGGSEGYYVPACEAYKAQATDFAKCMGVLWDPSGYDTSANYLLRDAAWDSNTTQDTVSCVHQDWIGGGTARSVYGADVTETGNAGIRPMIRVRMTDLGAPGWTFADGVLTVYDDKAMEYTEDHVPWERYRSEIQKVIITEDVTKISDYAFAECPAVRSVKVEGTPVTVGNSAFGSTDLLEYIDFCNADGDAPSFNEKAFSDANVTVLYPEDSSSWETAISGQYGGTARWRCSARFTSLRDGWAVTNNKAGFHYPEGYKFSKERKEEVYSNYSLVAKMVADAPTGEWHGTCFGLSLLAAANYYGVYPFLGDTGTAWFSESCYEDASNGVSYSMLPGSYLTRIIERAQLLQITKQIAGIEVYKYKTYTDMINDIAEGKVGPLTVSLSGKITYASTGETGSWSHTMVIDPSAKPEIDSSDEEGVWYKLALCDPNTPQDTSFLLNPYDRMASYGRESTLYLYTGASGAWKVVTSYKKTGEVYSEAYGYNYVDSSVLGLSSCYPTGQNVVFHDVSKLDRGYLDGSKKAEIDWVGAFFDAEDGESGYQENAKLLSFGSGGTFTVSDADGTILAVEDGEIIESREGVETNFITSDGESGAPLRLVGFLSDSDITITGDVSDIVFADLHKDQAIRITAGAVSGAALSADAKSVSVQTAEAADISLTWTNAELGDAYAEVTQTLPAESTASASMENSMITLDSPEGTTASVSYSTDTNTSTKTVIVGAEPETVDMNSVKPQLTGENISLSQTICYYTGEPVLPEITVTDSNGTVLTEGVDYLVEAVNHTEIGDANVTITGTGNFSGSVTLPFVIAEKSPVLTGFSNGTKGPKVAWEAVSGYGDAPEYTVYYQQNEEEEWTEAGTTDKLVYTISKEDLTPGAEVRVTVAAKDPDDNAKISQTADPLSLKFRYTLTESNLGVFHPSTVYRYEYQGPDVWAVGKQGENLRYGTDYTLIYPDQKVGENIITLKGKGGYNGTLKVAYTVEPALTTNLSCTIADQTWTGKAIVPKIDLYSMWSGYQLVKGTDYTVKFSSNKEVGTAKAVITLQGNYTGTITQTFKIKAKKITPKVTLAKTTYTYNGKVIKPAVTVKYGSKVLEAGTDYTVTYAKGRKNVGRYAVTVKLTGHYSGSKTVYFRIRPKSTTLKTLTAGKNRFTVKWTKQSEKMAASVITGYQLQYSTSNTFSSGVSSLKVKGYANVSKTIKNLKAGKTYYVRIRTYKAADGTNYYSAWSAAKRIKVFP